MINESHKTARMWKDAQETGATYKCDSMRYSKSKGFYDVKTKERWNPITFSSYTDGRDYGFDAFMNLNWLPDTLKAHELKEGNEYISFDLTQTLLYTIMEDGLLYSKVYDHEQWTLSNLTFNEAKKLEFYEV